VTVSTSREPARIAGMFDAIARRYDTLNHVLSLGLDRRWRRRAIRELHLSGRERVFDVCTGTGDLAFEAVGATAGSAREILGIDFAGEMLRFAQAKAARAGLAGRVRFVRGDAMRLPCPDESGDAVTVAFGIRNVLDPETACREFFRVLRPGGQLAVLEFGMPRIPGIRTAYRWYFRYLLPRVGGMVSRHGEAYSYLPASVQQFASPEEFAAMLERVGFGPVRSVRLTLGIVYLHVARRP
jgi:demethylmenaquinone methyltransferase/2-methoxy-6-polyprenyl-1,4-benzoquinol methylase